MTRRDNAVYILDQVVKVLAEKTPAQKVSRDWREVDPWFEGFNHFPCILVVRGDEVPVNREDNRKAIKVLNVVVRVWVKRTEKPYEAMDEMIRVIDNAIQSDIDQNSGAILTDIGSISQVDFIGDKAACEITYPIQFEYTMGER